MKLIAYKVALLALGILATGAAWWLVSKPSQTAIQQTAEQPPAPAAITAALAQIAEQSTGTAREPRIQAPPMALPAPASDPAQMPDASPPAGYAFSAFHGEMAKAPMPASDYQMEPNPTDVYPWLAAGDAITALAEQASAAGRAWTFGWVGVAPGADIADLGRRLEGLRATLLTSSGNLLRARLPGDAAGLERIAALAEVAGIAATPASLKLPTAFARKAPAQAAHDQVPMFVTLMTDDPGGQWRQALTELGAVVGNFDPDVRAYLANVPYSALAEIAAADFVLAMEPIGRVTASHDTSMPAMGVDALRRYSNARGLFFGTGGVSVPIGVMDTGLNVNHGDISSNRRSICGANLTPTLSQRENDQDLWLDNFGHGSHVTGTIIANGRGAPRYAGVAPLVRDIRFAKVLDATSGGGTLGGILRAMDFLKFPTGCGGARVKPLLVNMSLGQDGAEWEGRTTGERKLDATVWGHRQLYVVAQSNDGYKNFGDFAAAKNSLAVGAVEDSGDLAEFSSYGPTADGRLKPQVVGIGVSVFSTRGQGRRTGYENFSGTSMATPAVAGVATLLMDAIAEYREQPAAIRARLMASAIKPDAFLDDPGQFPPHNNDGPGALQHRYGLGKVSARTSILDRDNADGWVSGGAIVQIDRAAYGFQDIEVPEGASRLDVVLTWDERPSDTFAQPVLNDLDLWVDRGANCASNQAACGEFASRSPRDNVEWLILRNPPAGVYRLKVVPRNIRVERPRAALAWTIIRGPSTPQLAVAVDDDTITTSPGEPFEVEVELTTDGYVASGTMLRIDCRAEPGSMMCAQLELIALKASDASREDGLRRSLQSESGDAIALGELAAGETQAVKLVFNGPPEADRLRLYLTATAWNASSASTSVDVTVGDSPRAALVAMAPPPNDAFANAGRLAGRSGTRQFDLLLATEEPGEPAFARGLLDDFDRFQPTTRPRSLWYQWTAPATGAFRFSITPGVLADDIQLDLFEAGDDAALASLTSASAKLGGGLSFATRLGQAFRIRLGITADTLFDHELNLENITDPSQLLRRVKRRQVEPLSLTWARAERPANDDFELATVITGARGETAASNLGGTLQAGEFFSPLAATTWHRWTAPASGDWRFTVDRQRLGISVFTGDSLDQLRLVSSRQNRVTALPVMEGEEYRILVAARDAFTSGSDYRLSWAPGERSDPGNDDAAAAITLRGDTSGSSFEDADFATATVEPGEPVETGSRTRWWSWTAPAETTETTNVDNGTGGYTWRVRTSEPVHLAVFRSDDETLTPITTSAATATLIELAFDATAESRYLIAAGLRKDAAFSATSESTLRFSWGPTPANDALAAAEALTGASGRVTGSSVFATVEEFEIVGNLGDASLWWNWEPPNTAWYRFSLDDARDNGILAIYEIRGEGIAGLTLVATSRRLSGTADVVFQARAGVRYAIRLGSRESGPSNSFSIDWQEDLPPVWLRHAGAIANGDIDAAGDLVQITDPNAMAFNTAGTELYVASMFGLQVYSRNTETGALRLLQTLDEVDGQTETALLWDARASVLLAGSCEQWLKFIPREDGPGLVADGPLAGDAACPGDAIFVDSSGSFVHIVRATPGGGSIDYRQLDEQRTRIDHLDTVEIPHLQAATINPTDDFVYTVTEEALGIYTRDTGTGALTFVSEWRNGDPSADGKNIAGLERTRLLAIDDLGEYLLAFGDDGQASSAFDLQDPAAPQFLAHLPKFITRPGNPFRFFRTVCNLADLRPGGLVADVLCTDTTYSVRLLPDEAVLLRAEDQLTSNGVDAEGNGVPTFTLTGPVTLSPDDKHIYATTADGLVIFERR